MAQVRTYYCSLQIQPDCAAYLGNQEQSLVSCLQIPGVVKSRFFYEKPISHKVMAVNVMREFGGSE
jgi:hypothetical protein